MSYNVFDENNDFSDDNDSNNYIKIEETDTTNGKKCTYTYCVPYRNNSTEKRLLCFSVINNDLCVYGNNCMYAHTTLEQKIDDDKKFIYQIILDNKLMDIVSINNPKKDELYQSLLFMSQICNSCINNKCTGGYNCRNGVFDKSLKICKNDLLTGECLNKIININVDEKIIDKLQSNNFKECTKYEGCINGHHLTLRNMIPYYKHIHHQENSKKNRYQSIRYIDINPLTRLFKNNDREKYNDMRNYSDDSSTTDEEINALFSKKNNSDSENSDNQLSL